MIGTRAWWKRSKPPARADLLSATPVKNPRVRETPFERKSAALSASVLRLTGPVETKRLDKLLAPSAAKRAKKAYDLDELGAFVWNALNETRTVEEIIRHFAREKRVNLREAEVAVLAFLKTLVQRNLLALRIDKKSADR